ncbi:MAG: hypothetical protein [Caudoviricetes sp.]|nr:MAG: hypothetical protein [Caudoviricetes sp.]
MELKRGENYSYKIISKFLQENFNGTGFYEKLINDYKNSDDKLKNGIFDKLIKLSKFSIMEPTTIWFIDKKQPSIRFVFRKWVGMKCRAISLHVTENNIYVNNMC